MNKVLLAIIATFIMHSEIMAQTAEPYEISNFGSANFFDTYIDWSAMQGYPEDLNESADSENPLDWRQAWIANDATDFYIAYSNYGNVSTSWGQTLYLDTDLNESTGWQSGLPIGADYLIQGNSIFSYNGDSAGAQWQWNLVRNLGWSVFSDLTEIKFKRALIGSPDSFRLVFVGSNEPYGGTVEDLYPNGLYSHGSTIPYFTYSVATGGNSAPMAESGSYGVRDGNAISFDLYGTDPDNDALTYSITSDPVDGVLHGTPPSMTYTPNPGFSGNDFFSFTANDGQLDSEEAFIEVIVTLTGLDPIVYTNPMAAISVDGDLSDWDNLLEFPEDRERDVFNQDVNPINYTNAGMAHNNSSIFFYYENLDTDLNSFEQWTHNLFLDTDADRTTGLQDGMAIGPDFLIQGGDLYRYAGSGEDWIWSYMGSVVHSVQQTQTEIMIDRVALGNPEKINFALIGDNSSAGGYMQDFYPDGIYNALQGYRFFEYRLDNSIVTTQNTLGAKAAAAQPLKGVPNINVEAQQPFANKARGSSLVSSGGGGIAYVWLLLLLPLFAARHRIIL